MMMKKEMTKKQAAVLDYVNDFAGEAGYPPTVREIGEEFGISGSAVFDHLKALERKGMVKRRGSKSRSLEVTFRRSRSGLVDVPILGSVAAGTPLLAIENIEGKMSLPAGMAGRKDSFLLRVRGESMSGDGIRDGDYVLVKQKASAENGEIVVALIGDEATVKKFRRSGKRVSLEPSNPAYKPVNVDENCRILGKIVKLIRDYA